MSTTETKAPFEWSLERERDYATHLKEALFTKTACLILYAGAIPGWTGPATPRLLDVGRQMMRIVSDLEAYLEDTAEG